MSDKIDFIISDERDKWLNQSDEELFRSCGMEAFKGSGRSNERERLEYKRVAVRLRSCAEKTSMILNNWFDNG
jgi:hypothetical protein